MSKIFDVMMLCRKMLCKEFFISLMCNKNEVISIFGNAHQKLKVVQLMYRCRTYIDRYLQILKDSSHKFVF